MSFRCEQIGEIRVWTGDPDCNSAYAALEAHIAQSPTTSLPPQIQFGLSHMGNMGEAIAFLVGRFDEHQPSHHRVLGDNCANPLAGGSKTGLDILWLAFDDSEPSRDHAWIQEVKTTFDTTSASYISTLKADYAKLFGVEVGLSLEDRLGDASFKLEQFALEPGLARRARALGARSAAQVTRVTLSPTGVHDLSVSGLGVIEDVRITLVEELGWKEELVRPHLIALSDIEARFTALAR
jgi:hypothetical protein